MACQRRFDAALRAAVDGDRLLRSELEAAQSPIEAWVTIARATASTSHERIFRGPDEGRDPTDTELEGAAGGRIFCPNGWQAPSDLSVLDLRVSVGANAPVCPRGRPPGRPEHARLAGRRPNGVSIHRLEIRIRPRGQTSSQIPARVI